MGGSNGGYLMGLKNSTLFGTRLRNISVELCTRVDSGCSSEVSIVGRQRW